jgi:hypothetical protein
MFRPYLAILKQLFMFRKCRTPLDLEPMYFHSVAVTLKYACLRINCLVVRENIHTKGAKDGRRKRNITRNEETVLFSSKLAKYN